jgi:hypothetical protein
MLDDDYQLKSIGGFYVYRKPSQMFGSEQQGGRSSGQGMPRGSSSSGQGMDRATENLFHTYYKAAEKAGDFANASMLRDVVNQSLAKSNVGHGFYAHEMLEQAHKNGQLNEIGKLLGPGPNPFKGLDPKAPYETAFKEYTVKDGVLYLGDEPYL